MQPIWNGFALQNAKSATSFVFLLLLTWLVVYGPGVVSLDALLARGLGLGAKPPETPPPAA